MTHELTLPPDVTRHLPERGPCGHCGHRDARHRVLDAVIERWRAGEDLLDIAADHGLPTTVAIAIVSHWDDASGRWIP
ncbi:MAG: hypothetical protein ACO1ON_13000 [Nocardioides sp.]